MGLVTSHVVIARVCAPAPAWIGMVYRQNTKRMAHQVDKRHIGFVYGLRDSKPACNRGAASFKFLLCVWHDLLWSVTNLSCVDANPRVATRASSTCTKVDAGPLAPTKRQRPRHRRLLREHVTVALNVVHGGIGGSAQRLCARLYLASACRIQGSAHGDARSANCH